MDKCNCVYEPFCSMVNGNDIILPTPCEYRKDSTNFVEVVRCRDCLHYVKALDDENIIGNVCNIDNLGWNDNDFCSYGERKDNV